MDFVYVVTFGGKVFCVTEDKEQSQEWVARLLADSQEKKVQQWRCKVHKQLNGKVRQND